MIWSSTTDMGDTRWPVTDGVITLPAAEPADIPTLLAGRDDEWRRWLGPGDDEPCPTACIVVGGEVVGWIDYDTDQEWLEPGEVNVGYSVFASHRRRGYARRAVLLLVAWLAKNTDTRRVYLDIDAENAASLGVARTVGAAGVARHVNTDGRPQVRHVLRNLPQ
jgi:RimJ/RimL family protein N-acetyltransferase